MKTNTHPYRAHPPPCRATTLLPTCDAPFTLLTIKKNKNKKREQPEDRQGFGADLHERWSALLVPSPELNQENAVCLCSRLSLCGCSAHRTEVIRVIVPEETFLVWCTQRIAPGRPRGCFPCCDQPSRVDEDCLWGTALLSACDTAAG